MNIKKRAMAAMSGLVLLVSIGATGVAAASTAPEAGVEPAALDCFSDNANNGVYWTQWRGDTLTKANWLEDGDLLAIHHDDMPGATAVQLQICYAGEWIDKDHPSYDSYNWKTFDYDFKETRRVRFKVCQDNGIWPDSDCSSWKYANA